MLIPGYVICNCSQKAEAHPQFSNFDSLHPTEEMEGGRQRSSGFQFIGTISNAVADEQPLAVPEGNNLGSIILTLLRQCILVQECTDVLLLQQNVSPGFLALERHVHNWTSHRQDLGSCALWDHR